MPNKYQREIEEILRNLEQSEPKTGAGQRFNARPRRKPTSGMRSRTSNASPLILTVSDWLLISALGIALIAGGYAFIVGESAITGAMAIISFVLIILVACSSFIFKPRRPASYRYGNTVITPLRRGPMNALKTRWNLFKLKMRYNQRTDKKS